MSDHLVFPLGEIPFHDMSSRLTHQPKVEAQVVNGGNLLAQRFLSSEEMAQVSFGIVSIYKGIAILINRREIVFPLFILDINRSMSSE